MGRTLAVMLTVTTYGTWLRGDQRGWVEDGMVYPADPMLEDADRRRLKHPAFSFERDSLLDIGQVIGTALGARKQQSVLALAVRTWHVHLLVGASPLPVSELAKCVKDAVRYHVRAKRPIWTAGYDKRFCFNDESVCNRISYIERHNTEWGWPARPWSFVVPHE